MKKGAAQAAPEEGIFRSASVKGAKDGLHFSLSFCFCFFRADECALRSDTRPQPAAAPAQKKPPPV